MGIKDLATAAVGDPLSITISAFALIGGAIKAGDDIANGGGFKEVANDLLQMAVQPMVGLIPIQTDQYQESMQVETPESMVISAQDKQFITDNAAPHPRVWKIHGYIKSILSALETGVIIKPTILLQKTYLRNAARSRSPISFKTSEGEFVDALISDLKFTEDPKIQNAATIDISVKEFLYLTAQIATGATNLLGEAKTAAKSIPSFMSGISSQVVGASVLGAASLTADMGLDIIKDIKNGNIAGGLARILYTPLLQVFPLPIGGQLKADADRANNNPAIQGAAKSEKRSNYPLVVPLEPIVLVTQTIGGSTAYLIPLPDADASWRVIIDTSCGNYGFRFDMRWSYSEQRKFDNIADMIEKKRKQTNVFELSSEYQNGEYIIKTGSVIQPNNLRVFFEKHLASYNTLISFNSQVINTIKYAMSVQPFTEPSEETIAEWLASAQTVIDNFHTDLWAQNALAEVKKVYGQFLVLRDLFASPPAGGLIDYIYNNSGILPNLTKAFTYIQQNYLRLQGTFADLDAAYNALGWHCTVYAPDFGKSRTFKIKPNIRLFEDDSEYNLTITGRSSMGNGNIGFDQLGDTAFVIEILP